MHAGMPISHSIPSGNPPYLLPGWLVPTSVTTFLKRIRHAAPSPPSPIPLWATLTTWWAVGEGEGRRVLTCGADGVSLLIASDC